MRIHGKALIVFPGVDLDPVSFAVEHQVDALGRNGQGRVDGGSKRVHQTRSLRIEDPQRAGAVSAEAAFAGAGFAIDDSAVDVDMLTPLHVGRLGATTQVDSVATTSSGLAADGAITALIGIGVRESTLKRTAPQWQEPSSRMQRTPKANVTYQSRSTKPGCTWRIWLRRCCNDRAEEPAFDIRRLR